MSARSLRVKRRLQGIAFLAVVTSLISLSIAKYNGAFDDGVPVTLQTDRIGNQLQERSDVKVRGLIVGEVQEVDTAGGDSATVTLQMMPGMMEQIPSNVSARLLPKTLFGERFVSLVLPEGPAAEPLAAGDVIPQDRSQSARELESALDGLLPLLQAVEPQDLASTLGTLSQTLEGRGEQLGENLVLQQQFVSELNTALPTLNEDITRLADFSETLSGAAPDLLDALEDLSTTSRTVVEQRQNLATFFAGTTRASGDLRSFLDVNKENLISLSASSRPTLESLARYSPEYPCFLENLTGLIPRINEAVRVGTPNPGVYITLEVTNHRGAYEPGEEPFYGEDRGPRCYPIAPPGINFPQYPPDGPFVDGSKSPPAGGNSAEDLGFGDEDELTPEGPEDGPPPVPETAPQSAGVGMGLPNSPQEQLFIAQLQSLSTGTDVAEIPRWNTFMVGPLYRGAEVTLR